MYRFIGFCLIPLLYSCNPFYNPQQRTIDLANSLQERYPALSESQQILVATADSAGAFTGQLYGLEKRGNEWSILLDTIGVTFGASGVAPIGEKREGDKRTPGGAFALGPAFGYEPLPGLSIPYIDLDTSHYWVSASSSPQYNQLVKGKPKETNVEKMQREDELYEFGIVIQYNTDPAVPDRGSAIFIHVGRGMNDPTLGCIAMDRAAILRLLQWLDTEMNPWIVVDSM